ncbi:MAG: ABC transporter substrate-binding protein, partial [Longimicrobiales bacterium]
PLQEASLERVAQGRSAPLALISPTAPSVPTEARSVYSLAAAEPRAAKVLAAYALDNGLTTAALLYPRNRGATFEAEAFREAYEALGGTVVGDLTYAPGTTFFEEYLRNVERLLPSVLVLPLPVQDVELLAPQVTFFGLDSLEIRVMGTAAWTRSETLENVDPRHLNGVIVASPRPAETRLAGLERFVEAYEDLNRYSLRSPVPALGYDAASLLLEAIRLGARTPTQLTERLSTINGFEGASGVLSVSDGRIVREHYLACIQDGALQTVPEGMISVPIRVDRLSDPETDSIPEGPGRIVGFRCPEFGMIMDSVDLRSGPSGPGDR